MTLQVAAAVLLAALTHASWNAIAHRISDKLVGAALIAGGGVLIGLLLMPFAAVPAAGARPYLIASAVVHVAYFALLMLGALLSVLAYGLVLWAQTRAEPAPVAALRESSVKSGSCGNNFAGQAYGEATSYAVALSGAMRA